MVTFCGSQIKLKLFKLYPKLYFPIKETRGRHGETMFIVYGYKKNNHRTNLVKSPYGMHTKGNVAKIF